MPSKPSAHHRALNKVLRTLTDEQEQLENGVDAESPFLAPFLKYQNIDKLTREILAELIDHNRIRLKLHNYLLERGFEL